MEKPELVLKNCTTIVNGKIVKASIGIENGKISAVKKLLSGEKEIDCSSRLVLPGMIDVHVHFRVPGMEWKADWKHESRAALHGGITTVCDMPNNKPSTSTSKLLEKKRKTVSRTAGVDFGLHLGASSRHLSEIGKAQGHVAVKLYMGSSTGNLLVSERKEQLDVFRKAGENNRVVMVHAEDENILRENTEKARKNNWNDIKYHAQIRSPEAETKAVKQALRLRETTGNKLHFCHISSAESIPLISEVKRSGMVSCGVTPHHLFLSEKDARELGNFAKVNPPLRSQHNRAMLWTALNNGQIDIVESDHAPHTRSEKEAGYWSSPPGIPGIETTMPLLLDAFNKKLVSLERVVELCSYNPARLFGINGKGFLKKGFDADLAVIDLKKEWHVNSDSLFSKCGWSLFEGRRLRGFVEKTFLRGELRYEAGQVFSGKGKEIGVVK